MSESEPTENVGIVQVGTTKTHYVQLHQICGEILAKSLDGAREQRVALSHAYAIELELWVDIIRKRPEALLLETAGKELQYALLSLIQGHYSHAFKSLRLLVELGLQAVFLSAHVVELREWLDSRKETVWGEIMNDQNGIFSSRFIRAFDSELEPHANNYASLAGKIYRECSECVHGNVQKHIILPEVLEFDGSVFDLWHEKADIACMVVTFALCARYFHELDATDQAKLEHILIDRLGHIPEIRARFGAIGGSE